MTAVIEQPETTEQLENIHHLSYSTAKKIIRKGVDYALGTKLGLIDETWGKAADIGTMAHAIVLGGDPNWIVSPYENFRTKAAQEWKAEQTATIITEADFIQIEKIADAILGHPLAKELIETFDLEKKLTAVIEGVEFVGYADGISKDRKILFDLKTTAQFDQFKGKYFAMNQDFDLQASVYRLFGSRDQTTKRPDSKYYFIVAETVVPYRVQIFGTSNEFLEEGDRKLQTAIEEFKQFRLREGETDLDRINFNVGETENLDRTEMLGDWSN